MVAQSLSVVGRLRASPYVKFALTGAVATALAVAATIIVMARQDDGASPSPENVRVGGEVFAPATPTKAAPASTTPKPAATPTFPPAPPDSSSGGDRPIGPAPAIQYGNIPENANASPEFLQLRDQLANEINAYSSLDVAVAVTDLQNGQTISVNGNRPQRTGCTINMFALLAAVGEFEAGRARPDDVAYNIRIGIGASYPPEVRNFLQIVFGDFHRGEARAREQMQSWGMQASLFDHVPYYGNGTQNNLLTALETNQTLSKLYHGQLFNGEWTAYTLGRLRDIKPTLNYIIPGQLPAGAGFAHKIGYYADVDGWVVADAGIVTFTPPDGQARSYAITFLSARGATQWTGANLGARLSRVSWDWFMTHYANGGPPPPPPTPTSEPTRPPATARPTRTPMPTRTRTAIPTRTPVAATPTDELATP